VSEPPPAIEARGLSRRYGPLVALRPLDLSVATGSTLAVLGPNGAGKSTLLRLLAGLARPTAGQLRVGEERHDRVTRRGVIGLIGHATYLYPALTARENLILAGRLWKVEEPAARAEQLLAEHGLSEAADRPVGGFSRGMAQRVAIARALVHDPPILLLDEPFTGLDPTAADRLAERLAAADHTARGRRTILLVTHDLARATALADRALVLVRGRAQALAPDALSTGECLADAYRCTVARLEQESRRP